MKAMGTKRAAAAWGIVAIVLLTALAGTWQWASAGQGDKHKPKLTKAAAASIRKAFPEAKIVEIEAEPKVLVIYEVEMTQDGKELEAEVFVNGEILTVEKEISESALPKAVAAALAKLAKGAKIKEVEQKEIRAIISVTRFPKPKTVYEAEFVKAGKTVEVELDALGKVLKTELEDDDHEDDDADDDDGEDDDD
ncbi:MAG: hypothetical protein ACYS5V_13460 [Planctomycetota bacterium]|jgi:hypothetical protein